MYVAPTGSETLEPSGPDLEVLMDELANGQCTQDEFVERVVQCEARDEEAVWEVLALLDRHFRRKRIDRDTFVALKARLQRHSLGDPENGQPARSQPKPKVNVQQAAASPAPRRERRAPAPEFAPAFEPEPASSPAPAPARAVQAPPSQAAAPAPEPEDRFQVTDPAVEVPILRIDPPAAREPDLVDASFHREVRAGDLLCGRYRAVEILRRRDWMTLLEAVDETKAGLPGVRQRVCLQVLEENLTRDTVLMQRIGKLQGLSHPAITRVLDVEEDCGSLVLVSEFHRGSSLREVLERRSDRRVPIQSALAIVRTLAGALSYCHALGIAHGDVTTANVLVTDLGETRLQGFELRAQSHSVQPSADRMAFARLAYELLSGSAEPLHALGSTPMSKLRAPPGVTRAQWRALRDTLSGRDGSHDTGILAAFGGELPAGGDAVLLQDEAGAPVLRPRRHVREWLAAAVVAAILGSGIYLYLRELPDGAMQDASASVAATLPDSPGPAGSPPDVATVNAGIDTSTVAGADGATTAAITAAAPSAEAAAGAATPAPTEVPPTPAPPPRPARPVIDLASTYAWVDTTEPVARIWVSRRGAANREVTFRWWTETGTAQVDRDFRGIEPRVAVIPEGSRGVELLIPLMPDASRLEPRTFYVKIDEPGPGADLGTRTLMQVAIVPPGYPAARGTPATTQNLAAPPP
jgi:hypothetical protein